MQLSATIWPTTHQVISFWKQKILRRKRNDSSGKKKVVNRDKERLCQPIKIEKSPERFQTSIRDPMTRTEMIANNRHQSILSRDKIRGSEDARLETMFEREKTNRWETRDSDPARHSQTQPTRHSQGKTKRVLAIDRDQNAKTVAKPNAPRNPGTIRKPKNRSRAANKNQELCPKALKAEEIRYWDDMTIIWSAPRASHC